MKRILLSIVVLLLSIIPLFAYSGDCTGVFSSREKAMGFTGAAVYSGKQNYFENPASLYYCNGNQTFSLDFHACDDVFDSDKQLCFPHEPEFCFSGQFVGRNAAVKFGGSFNSYNLSEGNMSDTIPYSFTKNAEVDVVLSLGYKSFSAGVGVNARSGRSLNADLRTDNRFVDIFTKGLFIRAERNPDLTNLNVRAGLGYHLDRWSFGLLFSDLIDMGINADLREFVWKDVADSMCFGIGYCSDEFSKRGRLNSFVFNANAEFWHFLNAENSTIRVGLEGKVQFEKSWTLSVLAGAMMPTFDFSKGISTYGIQTKIFDFNVYINTEIPFGLYVDNAEDYVSFTVGVTYSV